jgi:membrane complex biogenesis BtpA family protein
MGQPDSLFPTKALIGCVHLKALPGAPLYSGRFEEVIEQAKAEAALLESSGFSALIVENFNDFPFYPDRVPPETVAALSVIGHELRRQTRIPLGINVLRNDAHAAIAIATVIGAEFVRVNVHLHAVVADQGIIQGLAHETMRVRKGLGSSVRVFADVAVKHASPLGSRNFLDEAHDLAERGLVDGLILSGTATGQPADVRELEALRNRVACPLLVGSGITVENFGQYLPHADGFIVGSSLKVAGQARNAMDPSRVRAISAALSGKTG